MQPNSRFKALVEKCHPHVEHLDPTDLLACLSQQDFVLIDVREKEEYEKGHIPGAVHLSKGVLEVNVEKLVPDENTEIVLYCGGGSRSTLAAYNLKQMGYRRVKSLIGGAKAWQATGKPWQN